MLINPLRRAERQISNALRTTRSTSPDLVLRNASAARTDVKFPFHSALIPAEKGENNANCVN